MGLLNMPAIVIRASADAEPPPLRPGEILPDPDFSLLSPTTPFVVGIRPHREGGVCLKLEDEPIPSRIGPKFLIHNYGRWRWNHLELRLRQRCRGPYPNADARYAPEQNAPVRCRNR